MKAYNLTEENKITFPLIDVQSFIDIALEPDEDWIIPVSEVYEAFLLHTGKSISKVAFGMAANYIGLNSKVFNLRGKSQRCYMGYKPKPIAVL